MSHNRKRYVIIFTIVLLSFITLLWGVFSKEQGKVAADLTTRLVYQDVDENHLNRSTRLILNERVSQETSTQPVTAFTNDVSLDEQIQELLDVPALQGAMTGISIRDAKNGELMYSHFGDIRLRPASNMKLLTAAVALEILGPDYQFTTDVLTDGRIKDNTLNGNLYLRGKGDPTLLVADLEHFAKTLKEQGIEKINGDLIADDYWYDDVRYSQDLNWSDEFNYTGAAVSALTISPNEDYHTGSVIIRVYPNQRLGEPPDVEIFPDNDYVTIKNESKTVRKEELSGLTIEREHGTNTFKITGTIRVDSPVEVWRSVWEPTDYVLHLFKQVLQSENIGMDENIRLIRGETPENADVLVSKTSMPLRELIVPFMKLSNNGHGEMLVKELGKVVYDEGSWDKGLQVMEEQLERFGLNVRNLQVRDGSGMSHKNLISANDMTQLLYEVQHKDWYPDFENAQPVGGEPDKMIGGTLRYRLTDESVRGKVQAKTGTLTGVSTLSGYMTTQSGKRLVFSMMMNNYIGGWMPSIQDSILMAIAEHPFFE